MSPELVGFALLAVFFAAIFVGFPVSFTLIFLSLAFGYFALGDMVFYLTVLQTIGLMKEEVLAAVPLFIFMGYLLEEGGLMERLFTAFRNLLAPVLARCDDDGMLAYLESSNPRNHHFYRRCGFTTVGEVAVAGWPPLWRMARRPRLAIRSASTDRRPA